MNNFSGLANSFLCLILPLLGSTLVVGCDDDGADVGVTHLNAPCVDSDGDGWGWDGVGSCIPGQDNSNQTNQADDDCVDPDGDGWGWNGFESCRVDQDNSGNGNQTNTNNQNAGTCVDSDGDGWGWDGVASCRVDGSGNNNSNNNNNSGQILSTGECTPPSAGTYVSSTTSPIQDNGQNNYSNNGPQCVGPQNQFDGPGLRFGDFLLTNNAWNGQTSSWNWNQCIEVENAGGSGVRPSWTYDWGNEDDLNFGLEEWTVKSYPEVIYGVKSQGEVSGSCEDTGLPVSIPNMPEFTIDYSYRANQTNNRVGDIGSQPVTGGDMNVAIESFFHSSCDIRRGNNDNVEYEIMVWLQKGNERRPSGDAPRGTYTDKNGNVFDVYTKPNQNDSYIGYVARNPITQGTIHWNEFIEDTRSNHGRYGIRAINESWCLGNILFGSEIWWGQGSVELDRYQINRRY
jgi:hypothetical protein